MPQAAKVGGKVASRRIQAVIDSCHATNSTGVRPPDPVRAAWDTDDGDGPTTAIYDFVTRRTEWHRGPVPQEEAYRYLPLDTDDTTRTYDRATGEWRRPDGDRQPGRAGDGDAGAV